MVAREVKVTLTSAKDLKNVNWRNGRLRPYVVVWVDPQQKFSTNVDEQGDTCPFWGETLVVPVPPGQPIEDTTLYIDVVHAGSEEDTKPLIGSTWLKLAEVVDSGGFCVPFSLVLKLKRPSGRHQGKLEVEVSVTEPRDEYYTPPPYGAPQATSAYPAPPPPPYGFQYGADPQPPQPSYSYQYGEGYDAPPATYGRLPVYADGQKSKFGGMGTGLAVGALGGVLGGLALAEGADAVEDDVADDAADRVEDNLGYDDDDF